MHRQPSTPQITGSTDVDLILGDPVEQVRAPESFNLVFARMDIDAVLVPIQVAPRDLHVFVKTAFKVVLLMIWLPDGLLSIPDRIRAKKQSRLASAERAAAAQSAATGAGART